MYVTQFWTFQKNYGKPHLPSFLPLFLARTRYLFCFMFRYACVFVKESFFFQKYCNKSYIKRMNFVISTVTLWLLWSIQFYIMYRKYLVTKTWEIHTIFPHSYHSYHKERCFKNARRMILPIYHTREHRCPMRNINNTSRGNTNAAKRKHFAKQNSHSLDV